MFDFFTHIRAQAKSSKNKLAAALRSIFQGKKLDPNAIDRIEALLYSADVGVEATENIVAAIGAARADDPQMGGRDVGLICKNVLLDVLRGADRSPETLWAKDRPISSENPPRSSPKDSSEGGGENRREAAVPLVIVLVGVNGSGKTTTAAKLAEFFTKNGRSVIVGACDTFRAAANEQIKIWAERLSFDFVGSDRGADAASVAFDTCRAAVSRGRDVAILDTAGRLHNKSNLMAELVKLKKVVGKVDPAFPQHLWLVIDGHLGANAVTSAKKFHEALDLTGIIVTKLDGTGRGGAVIGIYRQLRIPVYFIGTGEGQGDLVPFEVGEYVQALMGE
ncbi:MAG: signal recognition particle-docking protein FtsY [Puniceicoccales bacterium]|nr:signal recognition particle-docking protein FtsY [Puniceicoccales bacterium]